MKREMENKGTGYEILTKDIFSQIVNQNAVKTIDVKHNVVLQGRTVSHQIDVYWEFEVGGITYYTVVEAKNWQRPVDQGELIKFKGVINDLPKQPRGVFVTKVGYQDGAKNFADSNGILLYELREIKEDDLAGRIKYLILNLTGYFPQATGTRMISDDEWLKEEMIRLKISPEDNFQLEMIGDPEEFIFVDVNGKRLSDAQEIIRSFYPNHGQEMHPVEHTYKFNCDAFLITNNDRLPKIKVQAVRSTITVIKIEEQFQMGGEDIVKFILKNLLDNTEYLFDEEGNIVK